MFVNTLMKIAVAGATGRVGRHVVEVLEANGHGVVPISRSSGIDLITGHGLGQALEGVHCIIDVATGPSPDQRTATEFFTTATRNLQEFGERAGVNRIVVVSIIGIDRFTAGYGVAKLAHEKAMLAGAIPARILRSAQFHEFVSQLMEWGRRDEVSYVPKMRIQPVGARTVARALASLATNGDLWSGRRPSEPTVTEIAGPCAEDLVDLAVRLAAKRGDSVRIQEVSDPSDPNRELNANGGLLPGASATLAGPTFQQWLDAGEREP
jgi:uncharacterized protein YbjT (DUF2867 family)